MSCCKIPFYWYRIKPTNERIKCNMYQNINESWSIYKRSKAGTLNYHAQHRKSWTRYRSVVRWRPFKAPSRLCRAEAEALDRCWNSKQEMYSIDRAKGQQRVDIYRWSWEFADRFIVRRSKTRRIISYNVLFSWTRFLHPFVMYVCTTYHERKCFLNFIRIHVKIPLSLLFVTYIGKQLFLICWFHVCIILLTILNKKSWNVLFQSSILVFATHFDNFRYGNWIPDIEGNLRDPSIMKLNWHSEKYYE